MKLSVFAIALFMGVSGQMAHARMGIWNSPVETLEVPRSLSFSGAITKVHDQVWFANVFDVLDGACAMHLDGGSSLQIVAVGPQSLAFEFAGQLAPFFARAKTTYVPVHYERGEVIHPYFLVEIPGWLKFHLEIHRSQGRKTLRLWMLRGQAGEQTRVPIFTAIGA